MSRSLRFGAVLILASALACLVWVNWTIQAQVDVLRGMLYGFERVRPLGSTPTGLLCTACGSQSALPVRLPDPGESLSAAAARTWLRLQQPIPMPFPDETPLGDVLRYMQDALKETLEGGPAPVLYVDPIGLLEADTTLQSPVAIDLDGMPLARTLSLALAQQGLAYQVQLDGLLVITGRDAIFPEGNDHSVDFKFYSSRPTLPPLPPVTESQAQTWLRLHETPAQTFRNGTRLEEVSQALRAHGVSVHVHPAGLQWARCSKASRVELDQEGLSWAEALPLLLEPLGLTFQVQSNGLVVIDARYDETATMPIVPGPVPPSSGLGTGIW